MKFQTVGLIFGGQSPEHEVSIISARNVFGAIRESGLGMILIGIAPDGKWYLIREADFLDPSLDIGANGRQLAVIPGESRYQLILLDDGSPVGNMDVVFPVLHGPNGEDGRVQGLLHVLNLPYVGPGVLGSSAAMDKDVSKRLFRDAGLKIADFMVFRKFEQEAIDYAGIVNRLGLPVFVKPANMGSSVGISKVENREQFAASIELAFRFDSKIVIEANITGRELECAVLGNDIPETTSVGEIVMEKGFYDFEAKYLSEDAARLFIPANISNEALSQIQMVAREAFRAVDCEGMSRVDVFLTPEGDVFVNEINTIPGFTNISMYPKLWAHAGLPYPDLIRRLLDLAVERFERENSLQRSRA
jgi:D-alanine-D-alanine ligase